MTPTNAGAAALASAAAAALAAADAAASAALASVSLGAPKVTPVRLSSEVAGEHTDRRGPPVSEVRALWQ